MKKTPLHKTAVFNHNLKAFSAKDDLAYLRKYETIFREKMGDVKFTLLIKKLEDYIANQESAK